MRSGSTPGRQTQSSSGFRSGSLQAAAARQQSSTRLHPVATPLQLPNRPDEELLQTVRTEVIFSDAESVELIYEMIQSGEDPNQRSERGYTPLAVAAAAGSGPVVSLLLEKAANVALASVDRGELPLHYAASTGHQVVCQLLLAPTCAAKMLNAATPAGWTALHLAAAAGHEAVVRALLRAGASVDAGNELAGGHAASHLAVLGGHVDVLEWILDRDGDANAVGALGQTPLHLAAWRGDSASAALLLRHRADPLATADRGSRPLDLVPADASGPASAASSRLRGGTECHERLRQLLSAYARPVPGRPRSDARFDLPGGNDILSAYKEPVSWGLHHSVPLDNLHHGCEKLQVFDLIDDDEVWL